MYDYYLKCLETDYPELIEMVKVLGVLQEVGGQLVATDKNSWDYIGYAVEKNSGEVAKDADGLDTLTKQTFISKNAVKYVHVNIRSSEDLIAKAQQLSSKNSKLATQLLDLSKFFVVDAEGKPTMPEEPLRVFL